jgi:hypothetical protein
MKSRHTQKAPEATLSIQHRTIGYSRRARRVNAALSAVVASFELAGPAQTQSFPRKRESKPLPFRRPLTAPAREPAGLHEKALFGYGPRGKSVGRHKRTAGLVSIPGHAVDLSEILIRQTQLRAPECSSSQARTGAVALSVVFRRVVPTPSHNVFLQNHHEVRDRTAQSAGRLRGGMVARGRLIAPWGALAPATALGCARETVRPRYCDGARRRRRQLRKLRWRTPRRSLRSRI